MPKAIAGVVDFVQGSRSHLQFKRAAVSMWQVMLLLRRAGLRQSPVLVKLQPMAPNQKDWVCYGLGRPVRDRLVAVSPSLRQAPL